MRLKGIFYLSIALLTFAFTHITDKAGVNSGVDPGVFSFSRILVGLISILFIWLYKKKQSKLTIEKKHFKHLAIIGVLASGLAVALSIYALQFTTATNKGVMQGLYTAVTVILAYFLLNERLPKKFFLIFSFMIFGLVLLTSDGFLKFPNTGDFILFSTIPIVGFCNVYAKKTMKHVPALGVTLGRYMFGTLFLLFVIPFFSIHKLATIEDGWIWIGLSGILGAIRVTAFYKGIEIEGPTIAAAMLSVSPAITAISEFLFLKQKFSLSQILGLSLVVVSAFFLTRLKAAYLAKK